MISNESSGELSKNSGDVIFYKRKEFYLSIIFFGAFLGATLPVAKGAKGGEVFQVLISSAAITIFAKIITYLLIELVLSEEISKFDLSIIRVISILVIISLFGWLYYNIDNGSMYSVNKEDVEDEEGNKKEIKGHFTKGEKLNFEDAFYFSFVTGSTVGYGDISPKTPLARFAVCCQIFVQLLSFATFFEGEISIDEITSRINGGVKYNTEADNTEANNTEANDTDTDRN